MSSRRTNEHPGEPGRGGAENAVRRTGRRAPRTPRVTVTEPRITVVESAEPADPAALDTAITLFVKWAIRAHEYANPPVTEAPEAPIDHHSANEAPEAPIDHQSAD